MSRVEELQLSEICLSLQSEVKQKRQRALEKFQGIITDEAKSWSKRELLEIWQIMNKHVTKHLTDPAEACRILSLDISKSLLELLPVFEKNIIYLVPVLVRRLASQEILEPSEEVRLNCISLIRIVIRVYKEHLAVYHDDFIAILSRTVTDNYPKVKKESCEAISEMAASVPAQFYSKSDVVIKPILTNFSHQHYRIRVASVKAIGEVLLYGNSKAMEEVSTPMAERLFDQSGAVRSAVIEVAGLWLVKMRDRYSWWFRLIPLLLTGLHDEILEIREKAGKFWDAAGRLYLEENDNDEKIKDKMDFLTEDPSHYPPNIERPNLGCRIIVQQNIGRLVGGIARELNDWMADIRVRSAQLLAVLVLNAEEDITQHIEKLLPAMYKACNDEDKRVVINVAQAAEYMGYFVPPETYCKLVLPTLEEGNISSGHLSVFSAILRGSQRTKMSGKLEKIGEFLRDPNICRSKKPVYQRELLKCCEALLTVCQEDCLVISAELFTIIFTVWSMSQQEDIQMFAKSLLETLSKFSNLENLEDLFDCHLRPLLNDIKHSPAAWTVYSAELYIFKNCLTSAKISTSRNMDLILPILKTVMGQDAFDPELRLKLFILLSEFFQCRKETIHEIENLESFVSEFLDEILIPGLIWKAGKAAEAIRTSAIGCLCSLLDDGIEKDEFSNEERRLFEDSAVFLDIFGRLRPILVSLVDDNSIKTRLFALKAVYLLLKHATNLSCVKDEDVIQTYPAIIKRLDDGSDDVRIAAIEALVFVFQALPQDYDLDFGKSHIDYLYTSTIVHLDDPEKKFQDLMLDAMVQLAKVHPRMLHDKIEKCKMNFRNQSGLETLLKVCREHLMS